jgi:hypothetical protein
VLIKQAKRSIDKANTANPFRFCIGTYFAITLAESSFYKRQ